MFRKLVIGVLGLSMGAGVIGCESHAGRGALLGGAAGAGVGAIIGNNSRGRTGAGAAIGGAAGALGGALIGNEIDKKEARERGSYRDRDYYESRRPDYREDYYDRSPPPPPRYEDRGDYYEYRSYRSYGPGGSSYYESRRYRD
jgi:hypothetical protein